MEVSFLRTASREGYSDDPLCDVSEVKFIAFLHNVIKVCTSVKKSDVAVQSKAAENKHSILTRRNCNLDSYSLASDVSNIFITITTY